MQFDSFREDDISLPAGRLFIPDPQPKSPAASGRTADVKQASSSQAGLQALPISLGVSRPENRAILVKDIRLMNGTDGVIRVLIEFDHYHKPLFTSILDGDEPLVRVTVKNGKLSPKIPKTIVVSGSCLRRIRTAADKSNGEVIILFDLRPCLNCRATYVHYLGKNLFRVDIWEKDHPQIAGKTNEDP